MSQPSLEELDRRLTAVEAAMKTAGQPLPNGNGPRAKDWRKVVGMFRGDPGFQQMIDEGVAIRESDRESARRQADADDAAVIAAK